MIERKFGTKLYWMWNVMMVPLFNRWGQFFLVYIILCLFDFHYRSGIMFQHGVRNGLLECGETGGRDTRLSSKLNYGENVKRVTSKELTWEGHAEIACR